MRKICALAALSVAALAGTAFGGGSLGLFYPLDSAAPTGGGPGAHGWTVSMPRNDDGSTGLITMPAGFDYCFYGVEHTSLYINNNGNLTFDGPFSPYSPTGFPLGGVPMVAPFWSDVDTRPDPGAVRPTNLVYHQYFDNGTATVADDVFVVTWDQVGYYGLHLDLRNTFQVAIANDDNFFFPGKNTLFSFGSMEWTTGDASGGSGGFGGSYATVGINEGAGAGRFDQYGVYGTPGGVATLSGLDLFFNGCEGIVPAPGTAALLGLGGLIGLRRRR